MNGNPTTPFASTLPFIATVDGVTLKLKADATNKKCFAGGALPFQYRLPVEGQIGQGVLYALSLTPVEVAHVVAVTTPLHRLNLQAKAESNRAKLRRLAQERGVAQQAVLAAVEDVFASKAVALDWQQGDEIHRSAELEAVALELKVALFIQLCQRARSLPH